MNNIINRYLDKFPDKKKTAEEYKEKD